MTARQALAAVLAFLRRAEAEPTGLAGAVVALVVSALASLLLWLPLSLPSRVIDGLIPEARCTGFQPGSLPMYGCSAWVALLRVVGPVVVIAALIVLRVPLRRLVRILLGPVPVEARFLVTPVAATLLFVVAWSGMHYATANESGILPQIVFPAVVGLFTHALARYGAALQRALAGFFAARDRYGVGIRLGAAVAVPLVVSLVITYEQRVTQTALKEQIVVLIGLVAGYLALAPRSGDLAAGLEGALGELRRRP